MNINQALVLAILISAIGAAAAGRRWRKPAPARELM
jgi:hypothetical protein